MVMGRPVKFKTPQEMERVIGLYFLACKVRQTDNTDLLNDLDNDDLSVVDDIDDMVPTVSGLAYTLGMATETLRDYGTKDDFSVTVKRAKQRIEMSLENRLAGNNVTGAIFNLKNNFGWKDKTEQDVQQTINASFTLEDVSVCE